MNEKGGVSYNDIREEKSQPMQEIVQSLVRLDYQLIRDGLGGTLYNIGDLGMMRKL